MLAALLTYLLVRPTDARTYLLTYLLARDGVSGAQERGDGDERGVGGELHVARG